MFSLAIAGEGADKTTCTERKKNLAVFRFIQYGLGVTCADQSGISLCADGELMGIRGLGAPSPPPSRSPRLLPSLSNSAKLSLLANGQISDILTVNREPTPTEMVIF